MRNIAIIVGLMMASNLVVAQAPVNHDPIYDPSYSANNYKHPNKAAYAREHNLDKSQELKTVVAIDNRDYKHPGNNKSTTTSAAIASRKPSNSTVSSKHPFGL